MFENWKKNPKENKRLTAGSSGRASAKKRKTVKAEGSESSDSEAAEIIPARKKSKVVKKAGNGKKSQAPTRGVSSLNKNEEEKAQTAETTKRRSSRLLQGPVSKKAKVEDKPALASQVNTSTEERDIESAEEKETEDVVQSP